MLAEIRVPKTTGRGWSYLKFHRTDIAKADKLDEANKLDDAEQAEELAAPEFGG